MGNYDLAFFIAQVFGVISIILNIVIVQFKTMLEVQVDYGGGPCGDVCRGLCHASL